MKITEIETIRLKQLGNLIWVKIHTDEGLYGLGETFMWPESVEAHIHDNLSTTLSGQDPLQIDKLWLEMNGYLGMRSTGAEMRALSAVDIALWDLWGKVSGQPVYQLLGGKTRESIRAYNTCAGYRYIRDGVTNDTKNFGLPEEEVEGPYEDLQSFLQRPDELAQSLLEQGITAMKIWPFDSAAEQSKGLDITPAQLRQALKPFEKIRNTVGEDMDIMVEMHSLWNLPTAIKISRELEQFNPYWIEDPIKSHSLSNLAEFRQNTRIPVTASETLAARWAFKDALELRACDFVMPDLGWTGGLSEGKKIAGMAETFGLPLAPHDCTGPVVFTASVHLCLNAPNAVIQESVRAFYSGWYTEVISQLPAIRNGYLSVSDAPGLGIELLPEVSERQDAVLRKSR